MKHFTELTKGERFIARVADIRPDTVTIELPHGGRIAAKSLILPDVRIGDCAAFVVKDNTNGQIQLEMIKPDDDNPDDDGQGKKRRFFDMRI